MGLESATYVGDLTATNPLGSDAKSVGDDHLRLIKSTLRESFGGFAGAILVSGTDGGSANTYTLTPTTALVSYGTKMLVEFTPNATNTGASTLNISALGAKNIYTVEGAALAAGDLVSGQTYIAAYDGTRFRLLSIIVPLTPSNAKDAASKQYVDALSMAAGNMPVGGTTGQYLKKSSATNYDAAWSGITKTIEVLTSGTSWVCPAGITSVKATVVGGGGGGGRTVAVAGPGGGGGGCAIKVFTSTPAASYTYAIGAAGAAATGDSLAGSDGGNTTFNTGVVTVTGGGGIGGPSTSAGRALGGAATNGDINIRGGYGRSYSAYSSSHGGDSAFGSGGDSQTPTAAQGYGAGGYGNVNDSASEAGTAGVIVLEY